MNGSETPFIFKNESLNATSLLKISNPTQTTAETLQQSPNQIDPSKIWTNSAMSGLTQPMVSSGGFEFKDNDLNIQKVS